MALRVTALAAQLAIACNADPDCDIGHVMAEHIDGRPVVDCGLLASRTDEWRIANECLMTAVTQQHDFTVRWVDQGIEGLIERGLVGLHDAGTLTVSELERAAAEDGSRNVTIRVQCGSFVLASPCPDTVPCFRCESPIVVDQCRIDR